MQSVDPTQEAFNEEGRSELLNAAILGGIGGGILGGGVDAAGRVASRGPVSYTHLDVYKRQPVALTAGPQYTATVDWPYVPVAPYNWYPGLIPHVMGAFDYCVFRNADRSSDGTNFLFVGVAIGAPFSDGGQMKMSGYQVARGSGEASFDTFTAGGTLAGTVLTAQEFLSSPVCTSTDMVGAATSINPDDYYFDELVSTLLLSFETPPVPVFWANLRQAVETV